MLLLGTVSVGVMMTASFAYADGEADKAKEIEEIVVTGIRGSLRKSLDIKRDSSAIVDAISSEDIGKFPDKNIAESLQRVSGVTISRGFGEGAGVSIRGASQNMTLTLLNGQNVASTGWFVFEPARRSFNYALLPSELVGDIKIYKSSQADLAEGGIGGTVIVNTRKPLDMASNSFYGSAEVIHTNDSGKYDPQISMLGSWKNDEETLGVLVSGVYQRRQLQRQGNEAFWEWGAGVAGFEQDRQRTAFNGTIQYSPSENLDILVNYTKMKMTANNVNYALWLTQGNTSWSGVTVPDSDKLNGTPVKGPLGVAFYQARPREATMNSEVYDFDLTHRGDGFVLDFQIGKTTSTGGTDFEMVVDDGAPVNLGPAGANGRYDFSKGGQTWNTGSFDIAGYVPSKMKMGTGPVFNRTPKTDDEFYAQLDFELDTDMGIISSVKAGLKYADHNTTSRQFIFKQKAGFDPEIDPINYMDGTVKVGSGNYSIFKVDAGKLIKWAKDSIDGDTEVLGAYSEINEINTAAYVMANFEGEGFRGNAGVRYIHTNAESRYFLDSKHTVSKASYTEWLPSLNLVFEVADDVFVRTSAARVMTRPMYVDMYVNPSAVGANDATPNNQFWIIGNVGLKPFFSNQLDLSVEYYFDEGSVFSAAFFMKDVKNFVSVTEYHAASASIPFNLTKADEAAGGWTVQEKINGKKAKIKGVEFQLQREFDNGFGVILNYTLTDSKANDPKTFSDGQVELSDASKHSANASVYYENDDLSARVSYNYRSAYMLREVGAYGNRLHEAFSTVDMSFKYNVNDTLTVSLDVNNLFENKSIQKGNNAEPKPNSGFTPGFPLYEYETSRRIGLGVSFKY